jgi:hypothetical protein
MTPKNIKKCGANMACGDSPHASYTANVIQPGREARHPAPKSPAVAALPTIHTFKFIKHKP